MDRRDFLASVGAVGSVGIAGCTGAFETQPLNEPPLVENRPDAVYFPSHIEGMRMAGMAPADDYRIALAFSYPHRFWTVTGTRTEMVQVQRDDEIHLMASVWDAETGTVLPASSGLSYDVLRDGESVTARTPWPMLSQNMGFHFGDNVPLAGDGTYAVEVSLGGMQIRRLGAFAGRFTESATARIELDYARSARDEIPFTVLDQQGEPGAVSHMQMEMLPISTVPPADELPGRALGTATSGDAVFVAAVIEEPPLAQGDRTYLAVSPRTPYNRAPLPLMSLSARLERGGTRVFDGPLEKAIVPSLGYHYGAAVDGVESGDALTVTVDAPPQVARHEGYETAFLDMPPVTFQA